MRFILLTVEYILIRNTGDFFMFLGEMVENGPIT